MVIIPNRVRVVMVVSALALAAGLLTLALLANPTQAKSGTNDERVPFSQDYFNSCIGEPLHIDGTVHIVEHFQIDENGFFSHIQYHADTQGRGESLTTGAQYVFQSKHNQHTYFSDSADNFWFWQELTFIRQGSTMPGDDSTIRVLFHITNNANGETTALIVKIEETCH
jgi:hypothetical protein